jgi:hypothetical protein
MRTIEQMQTEPQITYFNRHENMDSETRRMILDTINDLHMCPLGSSTFTMENWLYGSFDGYDYSEVAIFSHELASITNVDSELGAKISEIFGIIEKYPRTANPNNNNF